MIDFARVYGCHAATFDQYRTGSTTERSYLEAVGELVPAPAHVLDVGCGSGEPIARYFIERGYRVTGVDLTAEMLDIARTRFPEMTWVQADMREFELDARFEIILAWDSFFHLSPEDQRGTLDRFRRHMAPRAALMFTSGLTEGGEVGGDLFGDQLYHGSLNTSEYREILRAQGLSVIRHNVEDPQVGGRTVWIAQLTT